MGEQFKTFVCSYRYDGGEWTFSIKALDRGDAERRLGVIKGWGRVDGELMAVIPAEIGFIARWSVAIRNWFARPFP